jgi:hypothetical protein
MCTLKILAVAAATLAAISAAPAFAQSEAPLPPTTRPDCQAGAPLGPPSSETTGSMPLSERLSQSKGVICPPAGIDPGIAATPPPGGGRTPVIPPPGTPGGDPSIQPK